MVSMLIRMHVRSSSSWISNVINTLKLGKDAKVRQIGDPVLRDVARPVELPYLISPEFQELTQAMVRIMREKNGVGISAPQIGVSLQVIAVEFTGHHLKLAIEKFGSRGVRKMEMSLYPLQILVNPSLTVVDSATIAFKEGCLSIENFSGVIPRAKEVQVHALSSSGEKLDFKVRGWTARIFQHEVDHLNGHLFVDSMLYKTLTNERWRDYKS